MDNSNQALPALIPLFQSLLWVLLIAALLIYFREDIRLLRGELQRRIKSGEAVELGPLKLAEKIQRVEHEQSITRQFLLSMGTAMYENLRKIASGHFGPYEIGEWSGLRRELYYLRDIGYIDVTSISKIPKKGDNLSEHVRITSTGKQFVELREKHYPRIRDGAGDARH